MVTIRTFNKFQQASQVFAQGEEITIELSVTNLTSKEKALRTSIHHFYLKNESGENVWDQPPPPGLQPHYMPLGTSTVICGNEIRYFLHRWDLEVGGDGNVLPIGDYVLEYRGVPDGATIDISII
jgi:hypothetical protein